MGVNPAHSKAKLNPPLINITDWFALANDMSGRNTSIRLTACVGIETHWKPAGSNQVGYVIGRCENLGLHLVESRRFHAGGMEAAMASIAPGSGVLISSDCDG